MLLGAVMMLVQGFNPLSTYQALFQFSLAGFTPLATTLKNSVPLILTGLSASIAFASGIVNLGQPGQLVMGALAATLGGLYLHLPAPIQIPVMLLLAIAGGMAWAGVAAMSEAPLQYERVHRHPDAQHDRRLLRRLDDHIPADGPRSLFADDAADRQRRVAA